MTLHLDCLPPLAHILQLNNRVQLYDLEQILLHQRRNWAARCDRIVESEDRHHAVWAIPGVLPR